jgi:hypothetical protein
MSFVVAVLGLWLFRWYVVVRGTDDRKAALVFAACIAGVHIATGTPVVNALVAGAIAAIAIWLLCWVDGRFHSLATIPLWFMASIGLWFMFDLAVP